MKSAVSLTFRYNSADSRAHETYVPPIEGTAGKKIFLNPKFSEVTVTNCHQGSWSDSHFISICEI